MRTALLLPCSLLLGCAKLTVPSSDDSSPTLAAAEPEATAAPTPEPERRERAREEAEDRIQASHILIAYQGAQRAKEDVTRTKAAALIRAKEVQAKAAKGDDFAKLAEEYSDGPSARKGGDLGKFGKTSMVKPFADAAFALEPGEVSDVVETTFGFHVIKRTE